MQTECHRSESAGDDVLYTCPPHWAPIMVVLLLKCNPTPLWLWSLLALNFAERRPLRACVHGTWSSKCNSCPAPVVLCLHIVHAINQCMTECHNLRGTAHAHCTAGCSHSTAVYHRQACCPDTLLTLVRAENRMSLTTRLFKRRLRNWSGLVLMDRCVMRFYCGSYTCA